jgi:hypothetical protein
LNVSIPPDRATAELEELYNTYRTAALNKEYYGAKLARYQRLNTIMEITIALGATSSGISALTLMKYEPVGAIIWGVITSISALLAICKPFLQINKKVERYSRLFAGHLDSYITLNALVIRIRRKRELTEDMLKQFDKAEQRFNELSRGDDPITDTKVALECEKVVRRRIPEECLWYPREEPSNVMPMRSDSKERLAALPSRD